VAAANREKEVQAVVAASLNSAAERIEAAAKRLQQTISSGSVPQG
jgi:hypothetical protein